MSGRAAVNAHNLIRDRRSVLGKRHEFRKIVVLEQLPARVRGGCPEVQRGSDVRFRGKRKTFALSEPYRV